MIDPIKEQEIKKIKDIRVVYENQGKRGSLHFYLERNGGLEKVIENFGNISLFLLALKRAGYSRQYIRDLEIKWKDLIFINQLLLKNREGENV
jgi:hypothetical protein